MPDINWSSLCDNSPYSTSLCDFVFDYNLSQVIQIPTHTGGNILDIVLTNTPEAVFNVNVAPFSPLRSDHFAVTFRLSYYVPVTSSSSAKSLFDYSKADWTGLLEYLLNYDFDLLFHDDIDIVWQSFKDLFLSSLHMYVPVVVTCSAANYTTWFNGPLNHKLKCLWTLKRHYAVNPTPMLQQRLLREELAFAECYRIAKAHMR